ncbi:MAG: 3-phosphoglycerate dehydrogenase family protein [Roseburia sp.]|nr:3-phosphoglycerate dehydrogenase family protein [Roseburia sp.]
MKEILKLNAIAPCAEANLGGGYKLTETAKAPVAVMLRSFSMHDYALPESVLAVARAGAGTNNIPVGDYAERGVVVFNTPGANANAVKELCLAALFLASRKITDGIAWTKTLTGDDVDKQVEKGKKQFAGHEIMGKTLGVVGLGAIGVQVGNNAVRLGMNVLGYDPFISIDSAWKLNHNITKIDSLDGIFSDSDYITLHVPLTDGTRGVINAKSISKMKDGVNIINLSRGELCVNADIVAAVKSGKINSYITDFAAPELLGVDGITVIPHLGASTEEAEDNCAVMAARELVDFIENGNITNSVNFPNCSAPKSGKCRVTVIHRNVKNVLNSITDAVSKAGINMENFISKSRGDYAYAIIDTDAEVTDGVLGAISACDNVLKVRKI